MRFSYRVYHNDKVRGKGPIPSSFNYEDQLYEYDHFPTLLHFRYSETKFQASCVPVDPKINGVIVTLITEGTEKEADESLAELLIRHNNDIPGLCLIVDKLPSQIE